MHVDTTQHKSTENLALNTSVEVAELADDLFVFHRATTLDAKGKKLFKAHGLTLHGKQSGFVDRKNMENLVKNLPFEVLELGIWTPEQLEQARLEGFSEVAEHGFAKPCPLTQLKKQPELTVENIVREEWASHMLFDRNGDVLPVAVKFDYIASGVDESHYDLEGLAEALLAAPDIHVHPREPGPYVKTKFGYAASRRAAINAKDAIFPIPSHNAHAGRTQSVQFTWQPSREDYAKAWAWAKAKSPKYASTRIREAFFALDFHGLSRFRRTPVED